MGNSILIIIASLIALSFLSNRMSGARMIGEITSVMAAIACLVVVAEKPSIVVALAIGSIWALRFILQRRRGPLIAGVVVGGLGLLNALAGGHSENSNPIQIGIEGVVFVHAYINPVALFAVLQLVLLNKGIREKAEIDWLSKTPVLFGLVVTSIVAAFAFGLMTNGVSLDPQKASALVSIGHGGGAVLFISMMLMHALVVATVEESLFRGVIQSGLRELFGNRTDEKTAIWGAILTSNVMFGLVHYKLGIYWMIGAAIAGIGYGIVYELYKGRLSTVVAVHASVVLVITAVLQNG